MYDTPLDFGNFITQELPYKPRYEDVLRDVEPLVIALHHAFDEIPTRVKAFFLSEGEEVDRYLFNDLVRYHVKRFLRSGGFLVDDDVDHSVEYEFHVLANNGLSGLYNGYHFRILKADHGDLPIPGLSERKQHFYCQQLPLQFDIPTTQAYQPLRPNIVILWEVDSNFEFTKLYLACPSAGGRTRDSVEAYFVEPIPHAATLIKGRPSTYEGEEEELEITRKELNELAHDIR